ncbi:murein hydrolase activator EnvC family protein [Glaciibacter flavus]|uniref:murein hydrolase activator EnvC family protein n=1 Tax=Orlajensenia flava TaxID=2565934 RepID=UPI003AFFD03A
MHDDTARRMAATLLLAAALGALALVEPGAARAVEAPDRTLVASTSREASQAWEESERADRAQWNWPLGPPVRVLRDFDAPRTRYSAGHRGIDLTAAPGSVVLAVDDGVVSFAGTVVDRGVISIDHGGGLVSSVEPVTASVAAGATVSRGQRIGMTSAGGHCGDACLHLGARQDGRYLSPLALIVGIPRAVLLPLG